MEDLAEIREHKYFTNALSWQKKHAAATGNIIVTGISKQRVSDGWAAHLQARLPAKSFTRFPMQPKYKLAEDGAFGLQIQTCYPGHGLAGFTPFACPEALVTLNGDIKYAGILASEVPGDSLDAKMNSLAKTSSGELRDFIKKHGFDYNLNASGVVLYVPQGYVVMHWLATEDATELAAILRWGWWPDSVDKQAARASASDVLEKYPFLEGSGYKLWLEALSA